MFLGLYLIENCNCLCILYTNNFLFCFCPPYQFWALTCKCPNQISQQTSSIIITRNVNVPKFIFTQPLVPDEAVWYNATKYIHRSKCKTSHGRPLSRDRASPWRSLSNVTAQRWTAASGLERLSRKKNIFCCVVIQYTRCWNFNDNMVSHRTKRILRYLGPFLFFVGLAYTALYPERKLLHYTNQEEKATTLFNSGSVTVKDEIPLASCRVSESFSFL